MDGLTMSLAAQKAIETLPKGRDGKPATTPEIRSDNRSCSISKEFRVVLQANGLGHHRIQSHCPEENELIERAKRTLPESGCRNASVVSLHAAMRVFGRA